MGARDGEGETMPVFRRAKTTGEIAAVPQIVDAPARAQLTPVGQWPEAALAASSAPAGPVSTLFAGVCRYYHDCFAADSRGGMLTNVLDKAQAEYLIFADGAEVLATGQVDRL